MKVKDYIAYKVKTGDTLKSLSERIGLHDYNQLRNFHNSICIEIQDLKTNKITKGSILYIPDATEVISLNKITKQEKKQVIPSFILKFSKLAAIYKVKLFKVDITGSKKTKNKITYTLNIKYLKTEDKLHFFKVKKNDFHVNNKVPQTKIQLLAMECAKAYYPLNIILNLQGEVVGIENMIEVRERWINNKTKIEENFKGQYVDSYIKKLDNKILLTNDLEKVIKDDVAINTILLSYKRPINQLKYAFNSYLLKHQISYQIVQETDRENSSENEIIINQEGIINDERNYRNIINNEVKKNKTYSIPLPKIEGNVYNTFTIDLERKISKQIITNYNINYTPNKIKKIHIEINLINN